MTENKPRCRVCGVIESQQYVLEPAWSREYEGGVVLSYECVRKKACASRIRQIENVRGKRLEKS